MDPNVVATRVQKNVRNPNHHFFSKKNCNYASNLYCNTPPICIAVLLVPLGSKEREKCQYSSHLYRGTPPICIAIRLPFVSQYFWENLGGCGHRDVPQSCRAMLLNRSLGLLAYNSLFLSIYLPLCLALRPRWVDPKLDEGKSPPPQSELRFHKRP